MDRDRQRLLNELRSYTPPPAESPRLDGRIDVFRQLLEIMPPKVHNYAALSALSMFCLTIGVLLLGLALFGSMAVLMVPIEPGPHATFLSDQLTIRTETLVLLGMSAIIGFWLIIDSQVIQLFLDLQANADRQSFALHGIFHLLLAEREDGAHDHT